MFSLLYWGAPAFLAWQLDSVRNNIVHAMLEGVFGRRAHWVRWIGVAIGLICLFFAAWNAFSRYRFGRKGERNVGWFSKLFARWLD